MGGSLSFVKFLYYIQITAEKGGGISEIPGNSNNYKRTSLPKTRYTQPNNPSDKEKTTQQIDPKRNHIKNDFL